MATLSEFVAEKLPSFANVYRSLAVGALVTVLSTFFVVPIYTLTTPDGTTRLTMLDDLTSNIKYLQTVPPPLIPLFYAYFSFCIAGIFAQLGKGFFDFQKHRANWFIFIAAILAAIAADQTAVHVTRNNHPDVNDGTSLYSASNGGLSYISLSLPATLLLADAYGIMMNKIETL